LSNLVFGTDKDIEVPVDKAVDESPAKSGPVPSRFVLEFDVAQSPAT
jgi:hypothetical protein